MTTDFTSATILGTKKTTTEKLSLNTQKLVDNNNMFDSLLTNATKSYTSKDVTKSEANNFSSKEYASRTKDVNSAKNQKNTIPEKTSSKNNSNENNSVQKKDTTSTENEITNKNVDKKNNDNTKVESEVANKNKFDEKTIEEDKNISSKTESKENCDIVKDDASSENNTQEEHYSKNEQKSNQETEAPKQETLLENENISNENSNKIINEQILANIELAESIAASTNFAVETQNTEVTAIEQQTENITTENVVANISNEATITTQNKILNNILENLTNEKINTAQQNVIQNVIPENINTQQTTQDTILNTQTNLVQNSELEVNTDLIKNSLEKEQVIKDLAQQSVQNAEQNNVVETRSAQQNLAADTARITLNLENNTTQETVQPQDKIAITPTNTIEENTETQIPTIKVTEEVATQVEANFANLTQNKDYAGEIKGKAATKLGDLQGTSTVVTEVQTSTHTNTQNQSQTNLGQNNNSSIQNNAAEQIAKLSVEDATTSADSFLSKLESKLNGTTKVANSQNSTLNKSDIMSQMNAKFGEMQQAGQNKVSIILQPENLGKVSVEIMNSKDGIVAKMTTDNQQVKELFDKNVEALKTSLSAQGVNVNSIKVECTNESSNNAMNFEREQFNQNFNNSSSNQNNNQTQHSNNSEVTYSTEYGFGEETTEDVESTGNEIKNTETIIKHDGKVDYKV